MMRSTIHERFAAVARTITQNVLDDAEHDGCFGRVEESHGPFGPPRVGRPEWERCRVRPPPGNIVEPGEWPHGWQYCASSASKHFFSRTVV